MPAWEIALATLVTYKHKFSDVTLPIWDPHFSSKQGILDLQFHVISEQLQDTQKNAGYVKSDLSNFLTSNTFAQIFSLIWELAKRSESQGLSLRTSWR